MDHAVSFVIAALCILAICYRFTGSSSCARCCAPTIPQVTPSHSPCRREELCADQTMGNGRPPFRRHRRGGAAGRPHPGRAIRLSPGPAVAADRLRASVARCMTRSCSSPRIRPGKSLSDVARGRTWAGRRLEHRSRHAVHHRHHHGRAVDGRGAMPWTQVPWGSFAVGMTIPIAIAARSLRTAHREFRRRATILGIAAIMPSGSSAPALHRQRGRRLHRRPANLHVPTAGAISLILPVYAFFAATALPVWLLLVPRDYLFELHEGRRVRRPDRRAWCSSIPSHPVSQRSPSSFGGGGPVIRRPVWPFVSITIACGAISGFHAFIGSGTTPKLIDKWTDIQPVAFGAMLAECVVGVMALIAATVVASGRLFRHQFGARRSSRRWA